MFFVFLNTPAFALILFYVIELNKEKVLKRRWVGLNSGLAECRGVAFKRDLLLKVCCHGKEPFTQSPAIYVRIPLKQLHRLLCKLLLLRSLCRNFWLMAIMQAVFVNQIRSLYIVLT